MPLQRDMQQASKRSESVSYFLARGPLPRNTTGSFWHTSGSVEETFLCRYTRGSDRARRPECTVHHAPRFIDWSLSRDRLAVGQPIGAAVSFPRLVITDPGDTFLESLDYIRPPTLMQFLLHFLLVTRRIWRTLVGSVGVY